MVDRTFSSFAEKVRAKPSALSPAVTGVVFSRRSTADRLFHSLDRIAAAAADLVFPVLVLLTATVYAESGQSKNVDRHYCVSSGSDARTCGFFAWQRHSRYRTAGWSVDDVDVRPSAVRAC